MSHRSEVHAGFDAWTRSAVAGASDLCLASPPQPRYAFSMTGRLADVMVVSRMLDTLRLLRASALCGLTALAVAGCSSGDDRAPSLGGVFGAGGTSTAPEGLNWESCPEGFDKYCAHVDVPLDWEAPDGESISVMIARLPARQPRTGQLWLLQGGPGGSGADFYGLLEAFSVIAPSLDIYTLDHRGVGNSTRLGCPTQEAASSPASTSVSLEEYPDCIAYVQQQWGEGLRHFNTTQASSDLAHLIEQTRGDGEDVFVLGVSYGTYWALRYLQLVPKQPTGVILDSIAPPNFYISAFDSQFDPVGKELMDACAQDAECSGRMGADPWAKLQEIFDLVDGGHCESAGFDRNSLRSVMSAMLRSYYFREFAPALAYRLERCSADDEAAIANFYEVAFGAGEADTLFSDVLHHHVALSELWASPAPTLEDLQTIVDGSLFAPSYGPRVGAEYDIWPRYPHDAYVSAWPTTDVPLLMMNGSMDPQTPLSSAQPVEDHLAGPHQHFVVVPYSPHTVFTQSPVLSASGYPCGFQMIEGFLSEPTGPVRDACLKDLRPISFESDPQSVDFIWGVPSMWDNPGTSVVSASPMMSPAGWTLGARRLLQRAPWLRPFGLRSFVDR